MLEPATHDPVSEAEDESGNLSVTDEFNSEKCDQSFEPEEAAPEDYVADVASKLIYDVKAEHFQFLKM